MEETNGLLSVLMDPQGENQLRRRACEECRRLKLKCDRKFPCHSCMRRGCAAICPNGTFQKGTRSLKTNSLKLHETITDMKAKMAQLEEALAALQAQVSSEPHPLLDDNSAKTFTVKPPPEKQESEEETDIIDSVGVFSIGDRGEVILHEGIVTTDYLLQTHVQYPLPSEGQDVSLSLPPDLILLSVLFPFAPEGITTRINDFIPLLPSFEKATKLVDLYFTHSASCVSPFPRDDFMKRMFHECYPNGSLATSLEDYSLHRLSILLMVFALGSLMDVSKPLCCVEAEEFHTLARACLSIETVYENSSLYAVISMLLMVWYYSLTGTRRTPGYRLAIWGVVIRLCQAIGLHHDPSTLNHDVESQRIRDLVYWEIYAFDFWQAFFVGRPLTVVGRPPSATLSHASHTRRPYELRAILDNPVGEEPIAWSAWKHDYIDLLHTVVEQALRSKGMTYSQILALDQKLRNHPVPICLTWPETQDEAMAKVSVSPNVGMQCLMRLNLQESGLLFLHRRFFVQALRSSSNDPLQHQFGQSVRAVFGTACAMVSGVWAVFQCHPEYVRRFPMAWQQGFSAAVALGSLIISAPGCILSAPALTQFDTALSLFRENQHIAIQPTNAVAVLGEMQHKAYVAMAQVESPVNLALKVHQSHSGLQLQQNVRGLNGTYQQKTPENSSGALPAWSGANTQNWRDYATPAGTPLGRHAELPPDDAIHVDITPEEPMTEHSNWQTFIYQFQNNDRSTSRPHR